MCISYYLTGEKPKPQKELFIQKLKYYRDRLLRIDWRNRSILLRRIYTKWSFDLTTLDATGRVQSLVEIGLTGKKGVCVIPDSDISEEALKNRARLTTLSRNLSQLETETGLKESFLGILFLEGNISTEYFVRAPLVLIPIKLEHLKNTRPPGWYVNFPDNEVPVLNRALLAAIRKIGGYVLPESFIEEFEDLLERISQTKENVEITFFNGIIELLKKHEFPINTFENKIDQLYTLEPISREDVSKRTTEPLHFVNYRVLGHFPQGSSAIFADYEELIARANSGETNQGIIDNLLEAPADPTHTWEIGDDQQVKDYIELDKISDNDLNLVLPSDASQDSVIIAAQSEECVVVRGPPGTGKSQVIVNLISNALTKDQKVLLVCQKRAALDVVFERLDKVGLAKNVVLLHDATDDRSSMYAKLNNVLERDESTPAVLDETLEDLVNKIDDLVLRQARLAEALWKPYFGGITAHKLYTLAKSNYRPILDLQHYALQMDVKALQRLLEIISQLESGYRKFDVTDYPWAYRKDFSSLTHSDRIRLEQLLNSILLLIDKKNIILSTHDDQLRLITSLDILANEKGMFRKIKPRWKHAYNTACKLLSINDIPNDSVYINTMIEHAKNGLELWIAINKLHEFLNEAGYNRLLSGITESLKLKQKIHDLKESLKDFDSLQAHDIRKKELSEIELNILDQCKEKLTSIQDPWSQIVQQEIYSCWIDIIEQQNPVLRGEPFETYLSQKIKLTELLNKKRELVVRRIVEAINSKIPTLRNSVKYRRKSEYEKKWNKLAHELSKKRRVKPVRKLVEEFGNMVLDLAPCWLASPEVVSEVFPLRRSMFDLVIFDEASQCAVERALPAIYRGKRIVIAGDEKQLRPFDLFQIKEKEDEDDELVDETLLSESLLILAKRIYGFRYLQWHYRSKYQELIDFSNHAFYEGNLQVAPSVTRNPKIPPIRWVFCNGVWENRRNLVEATKVVDQLKAILLENRTNGRLRSVGIITFNEVQQTAIQDEIDRRRESDPEFNELYTMAENPITKNLDDRPFVKNIENVQGDERDIILFSVAYARDPEGKFHLQFGSLSQEGGENRLNVAVTRAREGIVIVCSVNPEELRTEPVKNSGPRRLQDYLRYSKAINDNNRDYVTQIIEDLNPGFRRPSEQNHSYFESSFEEIVHRKLEELGYSVDAQIGYSGYRIDLAVVDPDDPDKYILGIECDGASFHSAKSVRERDVMRQEFLEKRGWVIERIWSRNWWRNPEREINRIRNKIEELRSTSTSKVIGE